MSTVTNQPRRRLIPLREVARITGRGRTSIYQAVNEGEFPQPIRIGQRSTRWVEDEVYAYVNQLVEKARGGA